MAGFANWELVRAWVALFGNIDVRSYYGKNDTTAVEHALHVGFAQTTAQTEFNCALQRFNVAKPFVASYELELGEGFVKANATIDHCE